jgi:hypothetical protein
MTLRIFAFALLPLAASAQLFTFGVQGGMPTQTPVGQTSKMPFVLGPSVDIRVSSGLSLETGLLYHRMGRGYNNSVFLYPENAVTLGVETWHGSALEIPFLAKYRFLSERRGLRPFLSAGPTMRRTSITTSRAYSVVSSSPLSTNGASLMDTKSTKWNVDPTIGGGMDFKAGRFHIEPETRYSYWGAGKTSEVRKNQVSALIGFRF